MSVTDDMDRKDMMVVDKGAGDTMQSFTNNDTTEPTNATQLAERDMRMLRQFLEAMRNKKAVGDNIRNMLSVNTNNDFLTGIIRDYKVFRGAIDVARQEKIDALEMVADHVEKTKQMRELTTAELKRVLVKQQRLLDMLQELRAGVVERRDPSERT